MINSIAIHNWPKILYLNFHCLPFHQAIKLPIDVYGKIQIESLRGRIIINGSIHTGMIKLGSQGRDMFPKSACVLNIDGTIEIADRLILGVGSSLISKKGSKIKFGSNNILGAHNLIFCEKEITFGNDFLTSWDCQIMDTDTHKIIDCISKEVSESMKPVIIGNHVWLGNGTIINKGTMLPSNTIVASRSLCNKDYTGVGEYNILAGTPAKVIKRNKKWQL